MKEPSKQILREIHHLYGERCTAIRERLEEFSRVGPADYFYELAYCILTPQSSAVNAARAVERLREKHFHEESFNPEPVLAQKDSYIRFHKTKSRLLIELRRTFPEIHAVISNGETGPDLREWLVKYVKGLGYKEASHFLRNIGHRNLAILDRHILKNLKKFGVIRTIPKSIGRKTYLKIEERFQGFAKVVGIPIDDLDLLFWSLETGEILK